MIETLKLFSASNRSISLAKKRLSKYSGEKPENSIGISPDRFFLFVDSEGNYRISEIPALEASSVTKKEKKKKVISQRSVEASNLASYHFDSRLFSPMAAGSPLDGLFSEEGGLLPATNYIWIGDPGIGKTTLILQYAAQLYKNGHNALFFSAEMSPRDLFKYSKRTPEILTIPTIYFSELFLDDEEIDIWEMLTDHVLNRGYEVIVIDSLAEVLSSVKDQKGWPISMCEKRFVDLMIKANKKHLTSFLVIQQVTKGGNFVGSNKLKHNTTGMMELRFENKTGIERYAKVLKNRSGFQYDKIAYELTPSGISWKMDRLESDKIAKEILVLDSEDDEGFSDLLSRLSEETEESVEISTLAS